MNKKQVINSVIVLVALFFSIAGCKKEENNPGGNNNTNSFKLALSANEAAPYQYITFELPEGKTPVSTTSRYEEINVGTAKVNAFRYEPVDAKAGHYYFQVMVPELAAGVHGIVMKSPFGDLTADITIKPITPIADPAKYIDDFEAAEKTKREAIAKKYDDRVKDGTLRQSTADSLVDFMEKAAKKSQDYIDQLPVEEKKRFAHLMEANKSWVTEYLTVINDNPFVRKAEGDCEDLRQRADNLYNDNPNSTLAADFYRQAEECEAQRQQARQVAGGRYRARWDAAWEEAKTEKDNTPGKLSGTWAFVSTLATSASKGFLEEALGVQDLSDPFALESLEDVSRKNAEVFTEGMVTNFAAGINLVNLSASRQGFSDDFDQMLGSISDYNDVMTDMGQFLPYAPTITVPSSQTRKMYVSGYTVDQISNPAITVQYVDSDNGRQLKFTSQGISNPVTSFTFRITVTGKFGTVTKMIDAELYLPLDKVLVGGSPWKVIYFNSDGEDMFKLQKRGNHFCNGTEYFDEFRYLTATMSFSASQGGSFAYNGELHTHKMTNEGTSNCTYQGTEILPENANVPVTWTFDANTNTIKIPEMVNDDVDEYVVTYQNNIITLKSLYIEIRLQKQ